MKCIDEDPECFASQIVDTTPSTLASDKNQTLTKEDEVYTVNVIEKRPLLDKNTNEVTGWFYNFLIDSKQFGVLLDLEQSQKREIEVGDSIKVKQKGVITKTGQPKFYIVDEEEGLHESPSDDEEKL